MRKIEQPLTEIEKVVLYSVPKGKENAISRRRLRKKLNLKDRTMREIINGLTNKQRPIVSVGNGYYRPASGTDFDAAIAYYASYKNEAQRKWQNLKKAKELFLMGKLYEYDLTDERTGKAL